MRLRNWIRRVVASISGRSADIPEHVYNPADLPEFEYTVFTSEFDVVCSWKDIHAYSEPDDRCSDTDVRDLADQLRETRSRLGYEDASTSWATPSGLNRASICILVDMSGSMKGANSEWACVFLEQLDQRLLQAGAEYEILGFTTPNWKGGGPRQVWKMQGEPPFPGRLCELLHIVFRERLDRSPTDGRFELLCDPHILKENVDGEALQWAARRMETSQREYKLLLCISDGVPMDDSTCTSNDAKFLLQHMLDVEVSIVRRPSWRIARIAINYANWDCSEDVDRLDIQSESDPVSGALEFVCDQLRILINKNEKPFNHGSAP